MSVSHHNFSRSKTIKTIIISALLSLASFSSFAGDVAAGKGAYTQKGCTACHGASGVSAIPTYPNLAGQKEAYLIDAMNQYKNGIRNNPIMAPMVAILNDEDTKNIAAYLASLK